MTLLRYWPHLIGAALVAFVAFSLGSASGNLRAAKAELALSMAQRDAAQQVAMSEAKARGTEHRHVAALVEVSEHYEAR